MISMDGVSSALIARNESWVRKQAGAMMRRLPSSVEKSDLIQVGLIAVAQAALAFEWSGDPDSDDAREAFVRYARLRVQGAMVDELRQMDHLERSQRRKLKVIQIARERFHGRHGRDPGLGELQRLCGLSIDEISRLDHAALMVQAESLPGDEIVPDRNGPAPPATSADEVEARVDTALVLRRLEKFFATLPERERQVIDAYLGVGMTPLELAGALKVSPSRVSQIYRSASRRIAEHFGNEEFDPRAVEREPQTRGKSLDDLVSQREEELARTSPEGPWSQWIETTLTAPGELFDEIEEPRTRSGR